MSMRQLRRAILASAVLAIMLAPVASAAPPALKGVVPPTAHPRGHDMAALAGAWDVWGFGAPADDSPLLEVRCEQSPIDPKIWFLPVSLGGEWENTCDVPQGAWLLLTAGGTECSNLEPEPYFGADAADLVACAEETFPLLSYIEMTVEGVTTTKLDRFILTSDVVELPENNLLSPDAGISIMKGYFFMIHPLSRGTHTLRTYDEFDVFNFQAGITYKINVR
jgi:hypothetical protein